MNKEEMSIIDVPYRELHLLMDSDSVRRFESCGNTVHKTYVDTENAVYSQTPLIFTTITHFLRWSFATRLFVHINDRTGCVFCMFGCYQDKDRFPRLKQTHPKLWEYCMKER